MHRVKTDNIFHIIWRKYFSIYLNTESGLLEDDVLDVRGDGQLLHDLGPAAAVGVAQGNRVRSRKNAYKIQNM
jgi:hypothetical protein